MSPKARTRRREEGKKKGIRKKEKGRGRLKEIRQKSR
jgi:hypothetical protein